MEAVKMLVVKNYVVNHTEYMVIHGMRDYMPGKEAIRLLAHRRDGVGADFVMVFTGSGQEPSFRLYGADGRERAAGREEYLVLAHYLRDEGISANAAELVKHLGEETLSVAGEKIPSIEIHVTESFLGKLRALEKASSAVA